MNHDTEIMIKAWDSMSSKTELTGESVSVYSIAKSMSLINFTHLLDEFLNLGAKSFPEGKNVGINLQSTHRTMQRLVICFALGIIVGLSEQKDTDPRNEVAIETAQKIAEMIKNDELPLGLYI